MFDYVCDEEIDEMLLDCEGDEVGDILLRCTFVFLLLVIIVQLVSDSFDQVFMLFQPIGRGSRPPHTTGISLRYSQNHCH